MIPKGTSDISSAEGAERPSSRDRGDSLPDTDRIRRRHEWAADIRSNLPSLDHLLAAEEILQSLLLSNHGETIDLLSFIAAASNCERTTSAAAFLLDMADDLGCEPTLPALFEAASRHDLNCASVAVVQSIQLTFQERVMRQQVESRELLVYLLDQAKKLAHDANNMLAAAMGNVNLARVDPDIENWDHLLRIAEHALVRMGHLTKRTMSLGQDYRRHEEQPMEVDLDDVVKQVMNLIRHRHDVQGVKIATQIAVHSVYLVIDRFHLELLLLNLVVNACHAVGKEGYVTVELKLESGGEESERILVSVTDDGCGIDDPARSKIFDFGYTTKGDHGNGIGLSTVSDIVTRYGGVIEVQSEPGKGSSFSVSFPVRSDSSSESLDAVHNRRMGGEKLRQK